MPLPWETFQCDQFHCPALLRPPSSQRQSFCATSGPIPGTTPSNLPPLAAGSGIVGSSIWEDSNPQLGWRFRTPAGRSQPAPAAPPRRQTAGTWRSRRPGWHKPGKGSL
uniref:(northern house mosquito) hypothetical protein n=1 Tax=Culex pipiens TaxID=7175 RepID=A0A8D7ZUG7_CULPI